MSRKALRLGSCAAAITMSCGPAVAEFEFSVYGGIQSSPHSPVTISGDSTIADQDFTAGWEGQSFEPPPYYGIRATWWPSESFGIGVDVNHAKVYADGETIDETGFERFEFSDGLNIVTLNAYRSWGGAIGNISPYLGGGIGVSVPHVELTEGDSETSGYQLTGPAVAWMAGATFPLGDQWEIFGEYKGTFSMNSAELDTGGTLETDIVTNSINLGVSFNF